MLCDKAFLTDIINTNADISQTLHKYPHNMSKFVLDTRKFLSDSCYENADTPESDCKQTNKTSTPVSLKPGLRCHAGGLISPQEAAALATTAWLRRPLFPTPVTHRTSLPAHNTVQLDVKH